MDADSRLLEGEVTGKKKIRIEVEKEGGQPPEAAEGDAAVKTEGEGEPPAVGMEEQLAEAEEKAMSYRESLMRMQAEFENYRKRQSRERDEQRRFASERVLKSFLPILDNLERAVDHAEGADQTKLLDGVRLVLKQFRDELEGFGVKPIEAKGEVFDPHLHEAMSTVETDGDPPDGTVVEVYQKGYLLHGKVLRPAMVGVSKLVDEVPGEGAD